MNAATDEGVDNNDNSNDMFAYESLGMDDNMTQENDPNTDAQKQIDEVHTFIKSQKLEFEDLIFPDNETNGDSQIVAKFVLCRRVVCCVLCV